MSIGVLNSTAQAATLLDPLRLEILACMREPDSAAGVARALGLPRQRVNYHVVELEKAGLLEVADVVVVHKADLPGADATYSQVHELLNLPGSRAVPVLKVSAAKRAGLEELWDVLQRVPPRKV